MSNKKNTPGGDGLGDLGENTNENTGKTPEQKSQDITDVVKALMSKIEDLQSEIEEVRSEKSKSSTIDINAIAEIVAKSTRTQLEHHEANGHESTRYFTEAEIDPEDLLSDPVIFYHYGYGTVIVDDTRGGKAVKTPHGRNIFFAHQATQKVRGGDGRYELYSYSTYPSFSKKESEWLRNHSKYGVKFFETANEAMSTNAEIAARITKHLKYIDTLLPGQIVSMYRDKGLPASVDITKMKNTLALELVKEEISQDKTAQETFFQDVFKSQKSIKDTFNPVLNL